MFYLRMGGERLAAFEDVVVVAINYRCGLVKNTNLLEIRQ